MHLTPGTASASDPSRLSSLALAEAIHARPSQLASRCAGLSVQS
ncbi:MULTISPECIES: hypothetical protein [Rothia]|nr:MULTISPECIES: hypothetical protein [Rothia]